MRKSKWFIGLVVVSVLMSMLPVPAVASSVTPVYMSGNDPDPGVGCTKYKYDGVPEDGATYYFATDFTMTSNGGPTLPTGAYVTIDVTQVNGSGEVLALSWSANVFISKVFLKAGPGGNMYTYDPPVNHDENLTVPANNALSHITFYVCGSKSTTTSTLLYKEAGATDVALPASPVPHITIGDTVYDTATVTSTAGTPTGTVQFQVKVGSGSWTDLGTAVTLVSGAARSIDYTPAAVGSYWFRAIFAPAAGSEWVASQSGNEDEPLVVDPEGNTTTATLLYKETGTTDTALPASPVPHITIGDTVYDTATVTSTDGTPEGTVQFQVKVGSGSWTNLGTPVTLVSGAAKSINYTPAATGNYWFRAIFYPANGSIWEGSQSGDTEEPLVVDPQGTTDTDTLLYKVGDPDVALPASPVPHITIGDTVYDTATVTSTDGTPQGTVQFQVKVGSGSWTNLGTPVTLVSGAAKSINYTPAAAGNYWFRAIFTPAGDTIWKASQSGDTEEPLVVDPQGTTDTDTLLYKVGDPDVALPASPVPEVLLGTTVYDTATVTSTDGTPQGTVQFQVKVGSGSWTNLGTPVTLVSGAAKSIDYTPAAAGNYWFRAVFTPAGDTIWKASQSGDTEEPLVVYTENQEYYSITVRKFNQGTTGLAGATFQLWKGSTLLYTQPLGTATTWTWHNLEAGTYTVRETVAPPGYELASPSSKTVTLPDDATEGVVVVDFHNTPETDLGSITVYKRDLHTGELVDGATFSLYKDFNLDGVGQDIEKIAGPRGTSGGMCIFTDLSAGTYLVYEVTPPPGYNLDDNGPYKVVLTETMYSVSTGSVTFYNDPLSITVRKFDLGTNGLTGATFQLWQGTTLVDTKTLTETTHTWYNLAPGTYTVTEVSPPPGYELADPASQTVTISTTTPNANVTVDFHNTPVRGAITVRKLVRIGDTSEALDGVTFALWKPDLNGVKIDERTLTGNEYTWSDLEPGVYTVEEVAAPPRPDGTPFELADPITVTVPGAQTVRVDVYNDLPETGVEYGAQWLAGLSMIALGFGLRRRRF